ncbi:MAG: TaqI-like C-terminal specificity domain-containing protein [Myxococcota bacterium]
MEYLTATQAAFRLGITPATLRNWRRAGVLSASVVHPTAYEVAEIERILTQLQGGTLGRLQSGVNRRHAVRLQLPKEYGLSPEQQRLLRRVAALHRRLALPLEVLLYLVALRWLAKVGELRLEGSHAWSVKRPCVADALVGWQKRLELPARLEPYEPLLRLCEQLEGDDPLGLLYLGLQRVGERIAHGVWFTPVEQVEAALATLNPPVGKLLDPCVGTGQYLVGAARHLQLAPEQLFGWDRDPVMVELARLNLLMAFPGRELVPQLWCRDALERLPEEVLLPNSFDVVVGNPPWGGTQPELSPRDERGQEPFTRFLRRGLELLREGGQLSFLLPASILNIRKHAGIRRELLQRTRIVRVVETGRPFSRVLSSVIRLELEKGAAPPDWKVELVSAHAGRGWVSQAQWGRAPELRWSLLGTRGGGRTLLEQLLQRPHQTLEGRALWALGIVTGDNRRWLTEAKEEGLEPLWRGREVFPYRLAPARVYLRGGTGAVQQRAPEHLYRAAPKLIYRFISKRLCFAYDDQQRLTLNSANVLIPALPGMSVKVVLGYLNAWLFQRVFEQAFATHKVLRQDLERLPFPLLTTAQHQQLEALVEQALRDGQTSQALEQAVLESFGLNPTEVEGWPYPCTG